MWEILKPADRVRQVGFCRNALDSVSDAPSVVPRPMGTDQTIQGLMFSYSCNEGVSGCLVVAALDVEGAQDGLTDQRCDNGEPRFQKVDEGGVGAELLQDLLW